MAMPLNDMRDQGANKLGLDDVEFVQIRYTDVPGRYLAEYIVSEIENQDDVMQNGIALDG